MKMNRSILFGLVAGVSALAFSSCAYDPYYAGGGYGGGYGDGYGYGGSGFSTSVFVSTGNPRWGYDPYAGAYYDYTRRSYYDPYLYGYYPVGYRPRYVYGAPHPHGWSSGSGYCPPPSHVNSHNLTNYHDRGERYRSLGRSWSDNVRVNNQGTDQRSGYGDRDQHSGHGDRDQRSSREGSNNRSGSVFGGSSGGSDTRDFTPQRSGNAKPDFRSRDRDSDARSSRSESFGRGQSPEAFTRSSRDGGSRDSSNRSIRSAPQIQRQAPQIERRAPQIERQAPQFERRAPQPERQAPQFERQERSGDRERGDSDRDDKVKIRGLGEG